MRKNQLKNSVFPRLVLLVLVLALGTPDGSTAADDYWPGAVWRTATPESQGMCSEVLADMLDRLWQKNFEIDSILIVRNGYVVLDTYHYPKTPAMKHDLYSCTKSVSSTLIGIAIDKGYIQSVDQLLLDFFPDIIPLNPDARKQQITLENVLQMATGLKCRDSIYYQWAGLRELRGSANWVQYMLDRPMTERPGERFEYCNGASFLLTAILQETTGQTGLAFAREHLFNPLGIYDVDWPANSLGQTIGWGRLQMRPRDMAKFGYLFLKGGRWKGRQIVSTRWVADATREQIPVDREAGYGYQWWVMPSGDYAAIGYRGQRIYVLKDEDMVVVFTGRLKKLDRLLPSGILHRYIIPAVKSEGPLPENQAAFNRLIEGDRFWRKADYHDRDQRRKALGLDHARPQWKRYVNAQLGFSLAYASDLVDGQQKPAPPMVLRKSGLNGLPMVSAVIDDIPGGLRLEESETYLIERIQESIRSSDLKVKHKEMIRLPDGTASNYCELNLQYLGFNLAAFGLVAYKEHQLVAIYALGGGLEAPFDHLRYMVRSLRFE
ncbi:MAG: serine hydrolase [Desulfobacterales bacterium]|jgi:CubicO group peptidase (beta-lactamase class C family)